MVSGNTAENQESRQMQCRGQEPHCAYQEGCKHLGPSGVSSQYQEDRAFLSGSVSPSSLHQLLKASSPLSTVTVKTKHHSELGWDQTTGGVGEEGWTERQNWTGKLQKPDRQTISGKDSTRNHFFPPQNESLSLGKESGAVRHGGIFLG